MPIVSLMSIVQCNLKGVVSDGRFILYLPPACTQQLQTAVRWTCSRQRALMELAGEKKLHNKHSCVSLKHTQIRNVISEDTFLKPLLSF